MAAKGVQGKRGQKTSGASGTRPATGPARPSRAVYRRRRLVVTLLALLVVAGLVWAGIVVVAALAGDKDATASEPFETAPTSAAQPSASEAAQEAEAEPSPKAEDGMCPPAAVTVAASTDAEAYPAGANPNLTLTVTNTGAEPCRINVGTTQMEFVVTSGSDRIFSSADCQDGAQDLVKEFEPGAEERANFTWERLRSAPGCTAVSSNPNPGWYVFTARLGETTSEKAVFQLD